MLETFTQHPQFRRILAYLMVGACNTGLTVAIMALLARCGLHYALYTAIGYGAGFLNSYLMNSRITFRTGHSSPRLLITFLIVNIGLLALVQALQYVLIEEINTPKIVAIACGIILYTGLGFVLNSWVLAPVKLSR